MKGKKEGPGSPQMDQQVSCLSKTPTIKTPTTPMDRMIARKRKYRSPRSHEEIGTSSMSGLFARIKWVRMTDIATEKFLTNHR
jgi:hypothetical protein